MEINKKALLEIIIKTAVVLIGVVFVGRLAFFRHFDFAEFWYTGLGLFGIFAPVVLVAGILGIVVVFGTFFFCRWSR